MYSKDELLVDLKRRGLVVLIFSMALGSNITSSFALEKSALVDQKRRLQLYLPASKEHLEIDMISADGSVLKSGLKQLEYATRDSITGETHRLDPALVSVLITLSQLLKKNNFSQEITIYSAFRSVDTNNKLGGLKDSLHLQNRAIDLSVSGVNLDTLKDLALASGAKGVGLYRRGFIHIDTGRATQKELVRLWEVPQ